MPIKSISDIDLEGKKVLFRFDFNVPLDENGKVKDDTRICRAVPTIRYAMEHGARSILASHLGRPKGERRPEMSLKPVAEVLSKLLDKNVSFVDDCVGPEVDKAVDDLRDGEALLLENLRFHSGETKNDPQFAKQLASLADVYVNDAFGTAHRAHASTVGVAELIPEHAAGFLMKEELDSLAKAFADPAKPVTAIFGGAKVSDKLGVLVHIVDKLDIILIGGGMANTFLKAKGVKTGASKVEEDMLDEVGKILAIAEQKDTRIILPIDVVVSDKISAEASTEAITLGEIPDGRMALDIGPQTIAAFTTPIKNAGTIIWNGPMGVFEIAKFSRGTMEIAQAVGSTKGFSIVGGGDTIRAIKQAGVADKMSYISTGGGAFMEFMEGKTLPGVAALES